MSRIGRVSTMLLCIAACGGQTRTAHHGFPALGSDSVLTGYGAQRRDVVTTATGTLKTADGMGAHTARFEQLLEGRLAGVVVTPRGGGEYQIRIRGATGDPLIVIDGTPTAFGASVRSALSGVNPADVARIDVLKDGAAAARYGSRGMHGVILITTHRVPRR